MIIIYDRSHISIFYTIFMYKIRIQIQLWIIFYAIYYYMLQDFNMKKEDSSILIGLFKHLIRIDLWQPPLSLKGKKKNPFFIRGIFIRR